jgi:phosphomevalonate kinase
MSKKIIALSGKQFSGKDTVAKILLEKLTNFKRVGIGDAIKIEYGKQKGLTFEEIEANKPQYRADLIALGDYGRSISPLYWLEKIISLDYDVMIPDLRVKSELEILKNANAITIRVEASREARALRGELVKEDDTTEIDLDDITDWDYVIANDSTYENLKIKAYELAESIEKDYLFQKS